VKLSLKVVQVLSVKVKVKIKEKSNLVLSQNLNHPKKRIKKHSYLNQLVLQKVLVDLNNLK